MLKDTHAFSSFSVNDLDAAKVFYGQTLGLVVEETPEGLSIHLSGGGEVFIYNKENHVPATFTVLNFQVEDIDAAVDALKASSVTFEHYDNGPMQADEKGIYRSDSPDNGPDIAWFKDPASNVLAVVQG